VEQVVFRFALQNGWTPLTGSTSKQHLQQDLAAYSSFELSDDEMNTISGIGLSK
jgi:diketogulonate reductase-like aldo/keto reductase